MNVPGQAAGTRFRDDLGAPDCPMRKLRSSSGIKTFISVHESHLHIHPFAQPSSILPLIFHTFLLPSFHSSSIHPFTYPSSVISSLFPFILLYIHSIQLFFYPFIFHTSFLRSFHPSSHPSIQTLIFPFIHPPIHLYLHPFTIRYPYILPFNIYRPFLPCSCPFFLPFSFLQYIHPSCLFSSIYPVILSSILPFVHPSFLSINTFIDYIFMNAYLSEILLII